MQLSTALANLDEARKAAKDATAQKEALAAQLEGMKAQVASIQAEVHSAKEFKYVRRNDGMCDGMALFVG